MREGKTLPLTIDASVFVASVRQAEPHYAASLNFINALPLAQVLIFCPSLTIPECSASVARRTGDLSLAQQLAAQVEGFTNMRLLPLTLARAHRAARLAALHRLRGADAVYIALAVEFGATVITWDAEMLMRGTGAAPVLTPSDWLAKHGN